jgi:hypothetical protein
MENKVEITPEEHQFEQEAVADIREDEVRTKIIEEFGFDETNDADRIDKLVTKEVENRKKLSKAIGQKKSYRDKVQELAKNVKAPVADKPSQSNAPTGLTSKDTIAIINAKVPEEDIDDVIEWATFKKISVPEALKSSVLKATLAEKAEFRKTAEASNTSTARRSTNKVTPEKLQQELSQGKVPTNSDDAEALFWARRGGKR